MSKVFAVSYDLNRPGQDYAALHEELKNSSSWWHYLDSTWLILTSESAEQLFTRVQPHLDKNDSLLIIEVWANYQGWLTEKAWEWIRQNVPATSTVW